MTALAFQHDFERARRTVALRDLWGLASRRSNRLLPYYEASRNRAFGTVSYRGVRSVPIDRIVGSVDRVDDFDRGFRPRRGHSAGRWQRVAQAHADGLDLPPVELYEIGGAYYVKDGHHRISVARHYGQQFIDAEVTAATTIETSAVAPARPCPVRKTRRRARSLVAAYFRPSRSATQGPSAAHGCRLLEGRRGDCPATGALA